MNLEQELNRLIDFVNGLGNKIKKLEEDSNLLKKEVEDLKKEISKLKS